jgi:starch synthase (maltosyl-transferring)
MTPAPGDRALRYVGDDIRFTVTGADGGALPKGTRAVLRTNIGRAAAVRREIIESHAGRLPMAGASWRDIPMRRVKGHWELDLALTEVGFFQAKAYVIDGRGRQHWPDGPDFGVSVHPDRCRSGNTIYCAFVRTFGPGMERVDSNSAGVNGQCEALEQQGYAVIPPSGKLRDVRRELPHILGRLGCRIIHLLPVNPVPTTFARFGRFGSPYASLDLTAIDPALVEFDKRTTAVDQFCELTFDVHSRGGRVFLDIVTNHTGWGSVMQENHPEWFLRNEDGSFASPGAWGVTWEDLVELNHGTSAPWDTLADVFLTWCDRGVDGFRCDAGYMVPMRAWRYITARVRQQYPDTVFLLEGLGGPWATTESLLTDGGMQWAYSELFQNYSGADVAGYLDYGLKQSERVGTYVHYSETHDNDRLAKQGRAWSLLRNRLCALASVSGTFGFTSGVEWLAREKINVHRRSALAWGQADNLVEEISGLNALLDEHPSFFDAARLSRLSPPDSPVFALRRDSAEGVDKVLVLANLDTEREQTFDLPVSAFHEMGEPTLDLLDRGEPRGPERTADVVRFTVPAAGCFCLASSATPIGLSGRAYRRARASAAWAVAALGRFLAEEEIGQVPWRELAQWVDARPETFLAAVSHLEAGRGEGDLMGCLRALEGAGQFPKVVSWGLPDLRRIAPVPPGHWLLIRDRRPFRARLQIHGGGEFAESIEVQGGHIACFHPRSGEIDAKLILERYGSEDRVRHGDVRFLPSVPVEEPAASAWSGSEMVLLTNGIGGMARLCLDFGNVRSKYDCLLGANLHDSIPVDRHVFVKRARVWVVADGFISPLDRQGLIGFEPGPPARWRFIANAGDGRTVEIQLEVDMLEGSNTTILRFSRPEMAPSVGRDLPDSCDVRLTVRMDIEDRNFHWETQRNPGADAHFASHCRVSQEGSGFDFTPAADRQLRVFAENGSYHHEAEWCEGIAHPVEQTRGQTAQGDAYSPGWFDLPLAKGKSALLVASADRETPDLKVIRKFAEARQKTNKAICNQPWVDAKDTFGLQLIKAARAFVVRRESARSVIAGYPWFLDWGRDSLICARGLLAAGMVDEVKQLLVTFGRFEEGGTLPNSIHGEDASNRDTSDAPLWYGVVCEDLCQLAGDSILASKVDRRGRSITDILRSIAEGYIKGTANGIHMDAASALIWSPPHFTWMDTNFPAATPRAGYPVEIQVLWIRLLRQLSRIDKAPGSGRWKELAARAEQSLNDRYWLEEPGYFSDLLVAPERQKPDDAIVDTALRSNQLFAVSLGLVKGIRAQRSVDAAARHLVVPGALRTLAPLPVTPPLVVIGNQGQGLNDPNNPYWGRYEGDEDTRRKPAYHNGTAWTWTFPSFCEALAMAWEQHPDAILSAKSFLGSMNRLLREGCAGQLPEIVDGDSPHQQRGCDAQAWGATEALRVWRWLNEAKVK